MSKRTLSFGISGARASWCLAICAWCALGPAAQAGSCAASLAPGLHTLDVSVAEGTRPLELFVPGNARAGRALALVLDLHGSGGNADRQAQDSGMRRVAQREGFLVANPNGAVTHAGSAENHYWSIPGVPLADGSSPPADAPDDVQYLSQAIDAIAAQTCVDAHRIYVTGMSGGARMSSLVGCSLSERIAAIAPVDGLRAGLPTAASDHAPEARSCAPSRPMPVVTFHGTDDHVNPYLGGGGGYWGYSVPVALKRWADINHCPGSRRERRVAPHVIELRYTGCPAHADVMLYRIEASRGQGGGHAWPTGTPPSGSESAPLPAQAPSAPGAPQQIDVPSREIDASQLIWAFFRAHRR